MEKGIKEILMDRDGMSADEADSLIAEAKESFMSYIDEGDLSSADNICEQYFGLEPDYMDELIF